MRQAPRFAQPMVGLLAQFYHRPLLKKLRRDTFERSLFGHSLRAVLTEFRYRSVRIRIGPRTAGAIESCKLIHIAQQLGSADDTGLSDRMLQGAGKGG